MYNKKNQKVKFKLRVEFIGIIAAVIIMITLSIVLRLPSEKEKFLNSYLEVNASLGLTSDHVYNEVDYDELLSKIKSSGYTYVFYGTPTNADSVTNITTINSAAVEYKIDEILYLDAAFAFEDDREETESFDTKLKGMEEKLSANLGDDVTSDFCLDYAPQLWVYLDGELIFNSLDFINEEDSDLTWSALTSRAFCFNLEEVQ